MGKINEQLRSLKTIFLSPGVLFGYATAGGLILVAIGHIWGTPPTTPPPSGWTLPWWADLFGKVGGLVVVGGVVGGVSRYLGAIGVFQEALAKVVTDDAYLDKLKDLPNLWHRLTQVIYLKNFEGDSPEDKVFVNQVHDAIRDSLSYDEDFFAKNLYTRLTLRWKDDDHRIIELERYSKFTVVPFEGPKPIPFTSGSTPLPGARIEDYDLPKKLQLNVDGVMRELEGKIEGDRFIYRTTLGGKNSYEVSYTRTISWPINIDPFYASKSPYVIAHMSIDVNCFADGIITHFKDVGVSRSFDDLLKDDTSSDRRGDQRREHTGIILPSQGFILVAQYCPVDSLANRNDIV